MEQQLRPTSPTTISQSSTPRPRSSNANKPADSSSVVTPPPPPFDSTQSLKEEKAEETGRGGGGEDEEDPIDALMRGCDQPFFMSNIPTSQTGETTYSSSSFSIDPGGIDLRGLDPLSSSVWSPSNSISMVEEQKRGGDWREIGKKRDERFDRSQRDSQSGEGGIVELVFSLENKLNFLSETVQDLQIRLRYFEQASIERDRQIEQLQRTVQIQFQQQQAQRSLPPSAFDCPPHPPHLPHLSNYFANRPLSSSSSDPYIAAAGMSSPPVYDFGSTMNFQEINPSSPSPSSHRRTLSSPSRTTTTTTTAVAGVEYLPTYSTDQSQFYHQHQGQFSQQNESLTRAYPPLNPTPSFSSRHQPVSTSSPSPSSSLFEPQQTTLTSLSIPTIFTRRLGVGTDPSKDFHHRQTSSLASSHSRTVSIDSIESANTGGGGGGGGGIWSPISSTSNTSRSSIELRGGLGGIGGEEDRLQQQLVRPNLHLIRAGGGVGGGEDGYNYRGLLENDNEIDEDIFVKRVFLQNDQQCSLFLQQRVKQTSTSEKKFKLLESVGRYLLDLSTSKFGNFLVSRCIEAADQGMITNYSLKFSNHFLELSLDPFGCHVVQKLLDRCDSITRERVIDELSPFPNTLLQKPSLHVWNRLLSQPNPPNFYQRLAETGKTSWSRIVLEEGGSLIVQHLLEDWSQDVHGSVVARELLQNLDQVATSACGSFVLVAFIDRNFLPFRTRVLELATKLSLDSFGAKLLERVLKLSSGTAPTLSSSCSKLSIHSNNNNNNNKDTSISSSSSSSELLSKFIDEITSYEPREGEGEGEGGGGEGPLLLSIASHQSGSNLLYHLITTSGGGQSLNFQDKGKLIKCVGNFKKRLLEEGGIHAQRLLGLIGNGVSGGVGGGGGGR